jgi:hypothetical protein
VRGGSSSAVAARRQIEGEAWEIAGDAGRVGGQPSGVVPRMLSAVSARAAGGESGQQRRGRHARRREAAAEEQDMHPPFCRWRSSKGQTSSEAIVDPGGRLD